VKVQGRLASIKPNLTEVNPDALRKFTNPTNGVADIKELLKQ
jgi:hypothetical protein